ncbi:MAG: sigma 54-interacting transcriptional regulator [Deltaproteobacteria bacterium]|nr:sigma 54-interacting transcriptional regulator [Deltaproteobacteria bacterium]
MPTVLLVGPDKAKKLVRIFRPLTTIGSSPDNDIRMERSGLEATHAQIVKDASGYLIRGLTRDMSVNGRRQKEKKLEDRDLVRIGDVEITFYANDEDAPKPEVDKTPSPGAPVLMTTELASAMKRIHEFSVKLLAGESTSALVEVLLDGIIGLTRADKGFLAMLGDDGAPEVRAARNCDRANLGESVARMSDSIVKKVIESKKPLVVSDAVADQEFSASASVMSLRLQSVMCCPLFDRERLIGVLYVGDDRRRGAFDAAALDVMAVFAAQASLLFSQSRRLEDLSRRTTQLEDELRDLRLGTIIGASDSMREVFRRVKKVATTDVAVLVTGETGTGKELIAHEIHHASRRAKGPFVVVNCGAIPENLLESELFGHVRGAFTGAVVNKLGRFAAADGGTLFLDEIGEMPLQLQVKLLRVLQEHTIVRVGATKPEKVDIRVVAATNRVLEDEIAAGRFREDLYYRLNVVSIELPPLRDRGDDLVLVAKHLLARAVKESGSGVKGFSKACLLAMRKYKWPGNVRQLENRIKKAVVLAEGSLLTAEDIDLMPEELEEILPLAEARARFETRYVLEALERNGGNRTKTAKELGVDPRTIFRYLAKTSPKSPPLPPEDGEPGAVLAPEDELATSPDEFID